METADFEDSTKEITVEIEKESTAYDTDVVNKIKEYQKVNLINPPAATTAATKVNIPTSYIWIILGLVVAIIIILVIYFYYRTRRQ